jgi:hypothetical protein
MSERWYLAKNKQKTGPFTAAELQRLAARKELQPADMLWQQGTALWAPANSLPWLFPPLATPPRNSALYQVFVSYSSKDKSVADALVAALERTGVSCWIAPRDIVAGSEYAKAIIEAIERARTMVLIFSHKANQSQQVLREVERVVSKNLPIISFRIENCAPSKSLEYFLSCHQWLDAYDAPAERYLEQLAGTVQTLLSGVSVPEQTRKATASAIPAKPRRWKAARASLLVFGLVALGLVGLYALGIIGGRPPSPPVNKTAAGLEATQEAARSAAKKAAADLFFEGVNAFEAKEWDGALKCLSESIRLQPGNADAYYYRGLAYLKKEDYDKAIEDLTRIPEGHAKHAVARSYKTISEMLNTEIADGRFAGPMKLREALEIVREVVAKGGKDFACLVDLDSFRKADPDAPDVLDNDIRLPASRKAQKVYVCLRAILSQVGGFTTAVVVSADHITITCTGRKAPTEPGS